MKLAIMQPYFLPYLGYFQLIDSVEKFIMFDDVNFIKQGWINRNNFLVNNEKHLISLPLKQISSYKLIKDINIDTQRYEKWFDKFKKTLVQSYSKAPYFEDTINLIDSIYRSPKSNLISELNYLAIQQLCKLIGIKTEIQRTAVQYNNKNLSGQERVIDICKRENATAYINAIGGKSLYEKQTFKDYNIVLFFLQSSDIRYRQFNKNFVPSLSIVDALMFNSVNKLDRLIKSYDLV